MKKIIVTTSWDDGHILDRKLIALLRKYHLKGTIYVSPFNREFEQSLLLPASELRQIASKDIEIGAHTMTHPRLNAISRRDANSEIKNSKKHLEKLLGKKVTTFCYPGGAFTPTTPGQVAKAGFKLARTIKTFKTTIGDNNFEVPTTVNAYNHYSDVLSILRFVRFNPITFMKLYLHWDELAIAFFDTVCRDGGVFHLWGHSWEIEKHGDWKRLERVFKYIANKKGVTYVTNGNLL